jgi:hypothetical protein
MIDKWGSTSEFTSKKRPFFQKIHKNLFNAKTAEKSNKTSMYIPKLVIAFPL